MVFVSGNHRFEITPARLGVKVDWGAAVSSAADRGGGFGPLRGLKRLEVRLFGTEVAPPVQAWNTALAYQLTLIAHDVNRPHRDAAVKLRGLKTEVVPGQDGKVLDRKEAADVLVRALGSLERGAPISLPVGIDSQTVTEDDLQDAADQVRTALSAPIRLRLGPTRWRLPRWKIAPILDLPAHGSTTLGLGGPGEQKWLKRLAGTVDREPRDATWSVGAHIRVIPDRPGVLIQREGDRAGGHVRAPVAGRPRCQHRGYARWRRRARPSRQRGWGSSASVGSYETIYGGDANRINNVQLVAHLIDGKLIGPGETFSFNGTTGERTEEKGFKEAPVIINGELGTGIAGGVCQVSTTVFNAAYEGGLEITERTTTLSTSATTRSAATRPSTIPTSTSSSSTTRSTGCSCGRSSARTPSS